MSSSTYDYVIGDTSDKELWGWGPDNIAETRSFALEQER